MTAQPAPRELDASSLRYGPIATAELPFVVDSWVNSHMRAPGMPPRDVYHHTVRPIIDALLAREDVMIAGALGEFDGRPDAIIGWIAWTWGKGTLPAVHYAYVRGPWRKRGVFNRLLKEAMVGNRFVYTLRGTLPKWGRRHAFSKDKVIAEALAKRGVYAVYVPASEWLERMR